MLLHHLGIINLQVHQWYRFLPACVRSSYEHEDMVNDVILHLRERQHLYSSEKAQLSTWVFQVAHNYCRDIVQRYQRAKRNAEMVEIDDPTVSHQLSAESFLRTRQAFSAVERVIEFSGESVQDLIEILMSGEVKCLRELPAEARAAIAELQAVAKKLHATADDFLLVYRHA